MLIHLKQIPADCIKIYYTFSSWSDSDWLIQHERSLLLKKKKNEKIYKLVYDKTAFIAIPNDCSMIVVCTKVCLPFHYTRCKYILTRAWLRHSSPLYNRWTCSDGYTHTGHPDTQIQQKPCLQKLLIRETFQKKTIRRQFWNRLI